MEYKTRYEQWMNDDFFEIETKQELSLIVNEKEIEDRFSCDLEFGTGGLRGVVGAGTNRINKYTIGKATMGLGKYLLDTYGCQICRARGVAIGYDTRNNSEYFSEIVANVLSNLGIKVYLDAHACPTPQLSFAVKFLNTIAGVVITASHNPKEYNGYKIYDEFGCQLVPEQAVKVIGYINTITDYHEIDFTGDNSLISKIDVTDNFVEAVLTEGRYSNCRAKENLKIVYTPLHGTGSVPIRKVFSTSGFTQVTFVSEQSIPDGDFPTVASPNPEDHRALELGIELAKQKNADIVLGTDPDCDRVGIAVKGKDGQFQLMTGNQVGIMLVQYILNHMDMDEYQRPAIIKTVVTSELGADIARKRGITVFSTLTGFKFIGEKITQFEQARLNGNEEQDYDFLFGYEESCGYLAGTHARDKDAVVSCLLICEMAAEAKTRGKTLLDEMENIYDEYGYCQDALDTFTLEGKEGIRKISEIMSELRTSNSLLMNTKSVIDFKKHVEAEPGFGILPHSNLLKFMLDDGSWVAIRPSGTEPKIKFYYSIKDDDKKRANEKLEKIRDTIYRKVGLKD